MARAGPPDPSRPARILSCPTFPTPGRPPAHPGRVTATNQRLTGCRRPVRRFGSLSLAGCRGCGRVAQSPGSISCRMVPRPAAAWSLRPTSSGRLGRRLVATYPAGSPSRRRPAAGRTLCRRLDRRPAALSAGLGAGLPSAALCPGFASVPCPLAAVTAALIRRCLGEQTVGYLGRGLTARSPASAGRDSARCRPPAGPSAVATGRASAAPAGHPEARPLPSAGPGRPGSHPSRGARAAVGLS